MSRGECRLTVACGVLFAGTFVQTCRGLEETASALGVTVYTLGLLFVVAPTLTLKTTLLSVP